MGVLKSNQALGSEMWEKLCSVGDVEHWQRSLLIRHHPWLCGAELHGGVPFVLPLVHPVSTVMAFLVSCSFSEDVDTAGALL